MLLALAFLCVCVSVVVQAKPCYGWACMCGCVCVSVSSQCHVRSAYAFSSVSVRESAVSCLLSGNSIGCCLCLFAYAMPLYKALFSCLIFPFVMLTALRQGVQRSGGVPLFCFSPFWPGVALGCLVHFSHNLMLFNWHLSLWKCLCFRCRQTGTGTDTHTHSQTETPSHNNDNVEVSFYLTRPRVGFPIVYVLERRVFRTCF